MDNQVKLQSEYEKEGKCLTMPARKTTKISKQIISVQPLCFRGSPSSSSLFSTRVYSGSGLINCGLITAV